jgi:AraC-like DNA-binding protein
MEYYSFNYHSHQEYEIYFFHSGECKYTINNQIFELKPGDIILLDGLTLHKANPRIGSPYVRSVLHFSPKWIQEIVTVLGVPNLLDPFQKLNNFLLRTGYGEDGQFVEEKMKQISALWGQWSKEQQKSNKNELLEAEIKLHLVQLLVRIYKMSQKDLALLTTKKTEKEIHAEAIASWINHHYMEKVSLDQISTELNLSKYYTSHVFKEITGFTVMEYVMGCRLKQVKYLLEMEPERSLAEVARSSGFESIAHFSRFFKEKVGTTPARYRKSKLAGSSELNEEERN